MIEAVNPALLLIISGLLILLFESKTLRLAILLFVPLFTIFQVFCLSEGEYWTINFAGYELVTGRVDGLSLPFVYIFSVITLLINLYGLHINERFYHGATLIYSGSSIGAVLSGDWFSFFAFWEIMAVSGASIVFLGGSRRSLGAAFRYLIIHLIGGSLVLLGIVTNLYESGFQSIGIEELEKINLASLLILSGFLLNAGCPPLHAWLPDAYPSASYAGTVVLSAFTTKCAVYAIIRVFHGWEVLIFLGVLMALYGIVYAVLENNLRKLLSYHIISQVGYMICAAGLGTHVSINGSVAHAICNIIYKSLLLMAVGSFFYAVQKEEMWELLGQRLYGKLKFLLFIYTVGALSISGVPLFAGFASKTVIMAETGEAHRPIVNTLLHLASVGTFLSIALKLPYGAWFGGMKDSNFTKGYELRGIPLNMYISMILAVFLCFLIGVYPRILYLHLPYAMDFNPYTQYNVLTTLQLFFFTTLSFFLFRRKLAIEPKRSKDMDLIYRKIGEFFLGICSGQYRIRQKVQESIGALVERMIIFAKNPYDLKGLFGRKSEGVIIEYDPEKMRYGIGVSMIMFLGLYGVLSLIFILLRF